MFDGQPTPLCQSSPWLSLSAGRRESRYRRGNASEVLGGVAARVDGSRKPGSISSVARSSDFYAWFRTAGCKARSQWQRNPVSEVAGHCWAKAVRSKLFDHLQLKQGEQA
eukprot:s964_g4.t2